MHRLYEGGRIATTYRKFHPMLPNSVVEIVLDYLEEQLPRPHGLAIDVGCGSGQTTLPIAPHFRRVKSFDISEAQIAEALRRPDVPKHVSFAVAPAERLPVRDRSAELIVGGKSIHWFDTEEFHREVDRILVPNGVVAAVCHKIVQVVQPVNSVEVNQLIHQFVVDYLEDEAKHQLKEVLDEYRDLPLPYVPRVYHTKVGAEFKGSLADVVGFLSSISCNETPKMEALFKSIKEKFYHMLDVKGSPESVPATLHYDYTVAMCRKPVQ